MGKNNNEKLSRTFMIRLNQCINVMYNRCKGLYNIENFHMYMEV